MQSSRYAAMSVFYRQLLPVAQREAPEHARLRQAIPQQLAQHAAEQQGAEQPDREDGNEDSGGKGVVALADPRPDIAEHRAAHSRQHGLGIAELFIAERGERHLGPQALNQPAEEDDGAEHVSHQHLQEGCQHFGDQAYAGLLNHIGDENRRHKPDAVKGLVPQDTQAHGREHPGEERARIGGSQIKHAEQHGGNGNEQNMFEFHG